MNEKIQITINNLDDVQGVVGSIQLLFQKLIYYYAEKDLQKLNTLILSCVVYFGRMLRILGYGEGDLEEIE